MKYISTCRNAMKSPNILVKPESNPRDGLQMTKSSPEAAGIPNTCRHLHSIGVDTIMAGYMQECVSTCPAAPKLPDLPAGGTMWHTDTW